MFFMTRNQFEKIFKIYILVWVLFVPSPLLVKIYHIACISGTYLLYLNYQMLIPNKRRIVELKNIHSLLVDYRFKTHRFIIQFCPPFGSGLIFGGSDSKETVSKINQSFEDLSLSYYTLSTEIGNSLFLPLSFRQKLSNEISKRNFFEWRDFLSSSIDPLSLESQQKAEELGCSQIGETVRHYNFPKDLYIKLIDEQVEKLLSLIEQQAKLYGSCRGQSYGTFYK